MLWWYCEKVVVCQAAFLLGGKISFNKPLKKKTLVMILRLVGDWKVIDLIFYWKGGSWWITAEGEELTGNHSVQLGFVQPLFRGPKKARDGADLCVHRGEEWAREQRAARLRAVFWLLQGASAAFISTGAAKTTYLSWGQTPTNWA